MNTRHLTAFVAAAVFGVYAQDVSISGTVTDIDGNGIEGATVYLVGQDMTATTDVNGDYQIATSDMGRLQSAAGRDRVFLRNGRLYFTSDGSDAVAVDLLGTSGRVLASPLRAQLRQGAYSVNCRYPGMTRQVCLVRFSQGNFQRTLKLVGQEGQGSGTSSPVTIGKAAERLAKTSVLPDTLRVSMDGFFTETQEISSYTAANVDATLLYAPHDSAALDSAESSEELDPAYIVQLNALVAEAIASDDFDSLDTAAAGNPKRRALAATAVGGCTPARSLSLTGLNPTLTLSYNCQQENTTGDVIIYKRGVLGHKYFLVHFTDAFMFRGIDLDGTVVLRKDAEDEYEIYPGPRNQQDLASYTGARSTNDRVFLQRSSGNKHRLVKILFLGALVRHRNSNTIALSFTDQTDNKVNFYKPKSGVTTPTAESDYTNIFREDFKFLTPSDLVFETPISCACPSAGVLSLDGKHIVLSKLKAVLPGFFAFLHFNDLAFYRSGDDKVRIADIALNTLSGEFGLGDAIGVSGQVSQKYAMLDVSTIRAFLDKIRSLHSANANTRSTATVGGQSVDITCLSFPSDMAAAIPDSQPSVAAVMRIKAVSGTCADRDPVVDSFKVDEYAETLDSLLPDLSEFGAGMLAALNNTQDALIYNATSQQFDWPAKALRAVFTKRMKDKGAALYTEYGRSVVTTFTEKLKTLAICETQ